MGKPVTEAIILAGGLGTRLRAEVPDLPKPMAPVAGRPFLEYQLDYLHAQGVSRVVMSVGYKHQLIMQYFGDTYRGMTLAYAIETEPLGTGGGLLLAWQQVQMDAPVVVINGDTWFPVGLVEMTVFHQQHNSVFTIAVRAESNDGRYAGIEFDCNNRIVNFSAHADTANQWINAGVYLVSASIMARWSEWGQAAISLEQQLISAAIDDDSFYAFPAEASFIDIGVPADYRRAADVMNS